MGRKIRIQKYQSLNSPSLLIPPAYVSKTYQTTTKFEKHTKPPRKQESHQIATKFQKHTKPLVFQKAHQTATEIRKAHQIAKKTKKVAEPPRDLHFAY
jgi:hypothetical protein